MLDADVYGFSIPRMLGVTGRPTRIGEMILPPVAHGVKVISVGMFVDGNVPVVWRGPMLHRALQQFLADVFWGDLDVLLLDLPPGTGDIAISTAQLIPDRRDSWWSPPRRPRPSEVAERAGAIVTQTRQRIAGVVENMSAMTLPDGIAAGTVRLRRRRHRRGVAEPADRDDGAAAGPDPARGRTARPRATPACRWSWPPGSSPATEALRGVADSAGRPQPAAGRGVAGDRARAPLITVPVPRIDRRPAR